jgi:hypothetical protein
MYQITSFSSDPRKRKGRQIRTCMTSKSHLRKIEKNQWSILHSQFCVSENILHVCQKWHYFKIKYIACMFWGMIVELEKAWTIYWTTTKLLVNKKCQRFVDKPFVGASHSLKFSIYVHPKWTQSYTIDIYLYLDIWCAVHF